MTIKTVYSIADGKTVEAHEDQVTEGLFHIPAGATEVEPPSFTDNQTCQFIDDKWVVADIPEPEPEPEPYVLTYADKRRRAYGSIGDQLDMQYHDQLDGTTTWKDAIAKVKSDNPKE